MDNDQRTAEPTCGEEVASSAEVPEAWARLMGHVAVNLEAHADWVGGQTDAAARERDGLLQVALAYRAMADSAARAASLMRAMRDLPAAPHDPARFDAPTFTSWMRAKIDLQRALAALLTRHAEASQQASIDVGRSSTP